MEPTRSPRYARIAGTGRYVPERMLTNSDLEERLGQPVDAWLRKNVGIERRHVMAENQTASDLAVAAAERALRDAGASAADVDLIIVATDTPDYLSPGTAAVVQAKLGVGTGGRAGAFDVNCACASWVTALDVASKAIATDEDYDTALVIGVYAMTRFLDWSDKKTCTLFADGAGAVVLRAGPTPGILAGKLRSFGGFHDALGIYTGGATRPASAREVADNGPPRVQFVRRFPPTFNTENWPPLIDSALSKAGLGRDDVDLYLFTQLNLRTIEGIMETLGQPIEKTHWIMHKWGYTGSACIPMALADACEAGRLRAGDTLLLCASGGGVAMAASVIRWSREA